MSEHSQTDARGSVLLRAQGLRRAYREGERLRAVLHDADLTVLRGEVIALLGRSGSGKSTLLNLLSGIDRPDGGAIVMDEVPLHALGERQRTLFRRRHIGFIYQFFNLIPTLTVAENVRLPLELLGQPEAAAVTAQMLAAVDLAERAEAFPDRLSGGEQQRVAIARALVHRPSLVLADEPTGNLDAESGARVLTLLQRLARERQQTLILVTHSQPVAAIADRVLLLDDGRLRAADAGSAW